MTAGPRSPGAGWAQHGDGGHGAPRRRSGCAAETASTPTGIGENIPHPMWILALDVGTSSLRAIGYGESGQPLPGVDARSAWEPVTTAGGAAELDPEALVAATASGIDRVRAARRRGRLGVLAQSARARCGAAAAHRRDHVARQADAARARKSPVPQRRD